MSFFKKLNTLVRAHINDVVDRGDDSPISRSRRKFLARHDIQEGLSGDVAGLRKRVDEALAYQDELQTRTDKLYAEISEWDQKADQAVAEGREQDARFAVERLQQAQRELEMNEAALREHRTVTEELISQVNMLEAIVDQSRRESQSDAVDDTEEAATEDHSLAQQISERLDRTRDQLTSLINARRQEATFTTGEPYTPEQRVASRETPQDDSPPPAAPRAPVDRKKVDDDLARRLSRLSKPEKDNPDS